MKTEFNEKNLALDSTLRSLINAFRYRGVMIMAIEFKHNGRLWRADTPEEAIELIHQLEAENLTTEMAGYEPHVIPENTWTADAMMGVLQHIGEQQKKFLVALANGHEFKSEDLLKDLNLDSEVSFAGVLSGLSKQAKKVGFKTSDIYSVRVSWAGKEKTRHFTMNGNFWRAAVEIGWPEKWN